MKNLSNLDTNMQSKFNVIIPARLASTRLPNKMLVNVAGKPLIYHTWHNACKSKASDVIIACDDQQIYDVCIKFGAQVVLTDKNHNSGTSRLAQASTILNLASDHIVVNVQGDEPLLPPTLINQVANNLAQNSKAHIATLAHKITCADELFNSNVVKVVTNKLGFALNFSRAPMPWARDDFVYSKTNLPSSFNWLRHIGIYGYKVGFLQQYVSLNSCALEECEKLEQLRALWHGFNIHVATVNDIPPSGIDNSDDLLRLRSILE